MLDLPQRYPTPAALKSASTTRLDNRLVKLVTRMSGRLADEITQILAEQTVVVTGTNVTNIVLLKLAEQIAALRRHRGEITVEVECLVEAHHLHPVLISMPGIGIRTATRLLTEVSGKDFASADHFASYAGLAPVTRRSGSLIRGEQPSRRGNKMLKRALLLSAFTALRDPVSRTYCDRKISQGKRLNQALIGLAQRQCDVLSAMLRDGTLYEYEHRLAA